MQYYLKADEFECKAVEKAQHAVASKYWFYLAKDGILTPYNSRLA